MLGWIIDHIRKPVSVKFSTFETPLLKVPGLHAGSAYAAGDTMGTQFEVPVPPSGRISKVVVLDLDKEQLAFDIVLLSETIIQTADDAAYDPTDAELEKTLGHISVTAPDYSGFNDNAIATVPNLGFHYVAPRGKVTMQLVTRGAPNYAAVSDLLLKFTILPDE